MAHNTVRVAPSHSRSGQLEYRELERKLAKIAGSLVEQRYNVRRSAGGRVGAALGTTVRLDRASGKPVSQLLSEELAKSSNLVRVIDLFRDWDENGDGAVSKDEYAITTRTGGPAMRPDRCLCCELPLALKPGLTIARW